MSGPYPPVPAAPAGGPSIGASAGGPVAGAAITGGNPPWRRLSPRMLLVHPVQELGRALPALIALVFAGASSGDGPLWGLVGTAAMVCLGLLRWYTTTYRIGADQVQVRRGLLRRRTVAIPRDRVRTVDLTAHLLHRALGLVRVTIGTGRNDRKEGLRLDGVATGAAGQLRAELLHRDVTVGPADPSGTVAATPATGSGTVAATPATGSGTVAVAPATGSGTPRPGAGAGTAAVAPGQTLIAAVPASWVRYGPFTLSGAVTVGVLAVFGWRIIGEAHIDPSDVGPLRGIVDALARTPLAVAVAEVVAVLLLAVALCSTIGYVLAFWQFRLTRQHAAGGGTLHVTRGLITTRATTIEERRLRGVELSEPLLLRAVGGARCIAIATGLRVGRGAERGGSLLLPPAPAAQARRVGAEVLGDAHPLVVPLRRHGAAASRRRYVRALLVAAILPAGLALLWWSAGLTGWAPLIGLAVLPPAAGLAADRAANLGHAVTRRHLVIRYGSAVRRRSVLDQDGIIGWHLRQSVFQRRAGLTTVIATTAAGRQGYRLPDLPTARVPELLDQATPGLLAPFVTPAVTRPGARRQAQHRP